MWAILKIDKKKFNILKNEFSKKLGKKVIFYQPKLKIEKYKKNKPENIEIDILGDYVFCYENCVLLIDTLMGHEIENCCKIRRSVGTRIV